MGCHFLLQGIFPTHRLPPLAGRFLTTEPPGKPFLISKAEIIFTPALVPTARHTGRLWGTWDRGSWGLGWVNSCTISRVIQVPSEVVVPAPALQETQTELKGFLIPANQGQLPASVKQRKEAGIPRTFHSISSAKWFRSQPQQTQSWTLLPVVRFPGSSHSGLDLCSSSRIPGGPFAQGQARQPSILSTELNPHQEWRTATPCSPVSHPPDSVAPWSSPGQVSPAPIWHPEELTAELTPSPSARPLLVQTHHSASLAEPGMGHAPDRLKSHSGPQICPVRRSLKCLHTHDGYGGGEEGSFGGAESPARRCMVPGPGRRRTSAGSPASLRTPARPAARLCPPRPPSRRSCRGLLHSENASLLHPLALCPKAGDLGKPKCFPTGKHAPPAPEASS